MTNVEKLRFGDGDIAVSYDARGLVLTGSNGPDSIKVIGQYPVRIEGSGDADDLRGGADADVLLGGAGNDTLDVSGFSSNQKIDLRPTTKNNKSPFSFSIAASS